MTDVCASESQGPRPAMSVTAETKPGRAMRAAAQSTARPPMSKPRLIPEPSALGWPAVLPRRTELAPSLAGLDAGR